MRGKDDDVGATSKEQLLALVQRRGTARNALSLFIHQASALVRNGSVKPASSTVLSLLSAAVERRQSEWTQALTEEREAKRQRVNSSKSDVVFAAKMAQSLVKVYAATNGAAVKEEELEDMMAAMDLACVALYVVCALEHSVRLGDLVVDNLLYQVAKKYAEMPKMRESACCVAACVHVRLWNAHSELCNGSNEKSHLMQLLDQRGEDNDILASKVMKKVELAAEFPYPRSFHTVPFARLLLGHTNTCITLLSAVKNHNAVLQVAETTLAPWISYLQKVPGQAAKLASSFSDRTFRILWKFATTVESAGQTTVEVSSVALQFRSAALPFLLKCSNYSSSYFIQQVHRVGVQHERSTRRSEKGLKELLEFYDRSANALTASLPVSTQVYRSDSLQWEYLQWIQHFALTCEMSGMHLKSAKLLENAVQYAQLFGRTAEPILSCLLFSIAGNLFSAASSEKREKASSARNGFGSLSFDTNMESGPGRIIVDQVFKTSSDEWMDKCEKAARVCLTKLESLAPFNFAALDSQDRFVPFMTRIMKRSATKVFNYTIGVQHAAKYQLYHQVITSLGDMCKAVKGLRSASDIKLTETLILEESRLHRMAVVLSARCYVASNAPGMEPALHTLSRHVTLLRELLDDATMDRKRNDSILQGVLGDLNSIARECYSCAARCYKTRDYQDTISALSGAFELAESYLEYVMCSNLSAEDIRKAHIDLKVDYIVSLLAHCFHELGDATKSRVFTGYSLLYCGDIHENIPHASIDKYVFYILKELLKDQTEPSIENEFKIFLDNAIHVFKSRQIPENQIVVLCKAFRHAFQRESAKIMVTLRTRNYEASDDGISCVSVQLCGALENYLNGELMKIMMKAVDGDLFEGVLLNVSQSLVQRKQIYCSYYTKRDFSGTAERLLRVRHSLTVAAENLQYFADVPAFDLGGIYGWRGVITMEIALMNSYAASSPDEDEVSGNMSASEESAIADIERCLMYMDREHGSGFLFDGPYLVYCLESVCNTLSLISCAPLEQTARMLLKTFQLSESTHNSSLSVISPPPFRLFDMNTKDVVVEAAVVASSNTDVNNEVQLFELVDKELFAAEASHFEGVTDQACQHLLNVITIIGDIKQSQRNYPLAVTSKAIGMRELLVHLILSDIHFREGRSEYAIAEVKSALRICWKMAKKFTATSSPADTTYFELPPEISTAKYQQQKSAHFLYFMALECSSWDLLLTAKLLLCRIASLYSLADQPHRAASYLTEAMRLVGGLRLCFFRRRPFYEYAELELSANRLEKAKAAIYLLASVPGLDRLRSNPATGDIASRYHSCIESDLAFIEQKCNEIIQRGDVHLSEGDQGIAQSCYLEAIEVLSTAQGSESSVSKGMGRIKARCWLETLLVSMKKLKRAMKGCDAHLERIKCMLELGRINTQLLHSGSPRAFTSLNRTIDLLEKAYLLGDHLGIPHLSQTLRTTLGMAYFAEIEDKVDSMDGSERSLYLSWASSMLLANADSSDVIDKMVVPIETDNDTSAQETLMMQLERLATGSSATPDLEPHKHLTRMTQAMNENIQQLPDNWIIVSLMIGLSSEVVITRFPTNGVAPMSFCLPKVAWAEYIREMDSIIQDSRDILSGHTAEEASSWSTEQKKLWWNTREQLDERIKKTIFSMQETFGFWRCLLVGGPSTTESEIIQRCWNLLAKRKTSPIKLAERNHALLCAIANVQQCLSDSEVIDGLNHIAAEIEVPISDSIVREALQLLRMKLGEPKSSPPKSIHSRLTKLTTEQIAKLKVGEVKQLLAGEGLSTDGLKKTLIQRLIAARDSTLVEKLRSHAEGTNVRISPEFSTILVLNYQLQQFPWEGMDVMDLCSNVTRMPSLDLIVQNAKLSSSIRRDQVRFLLNPAGDLKSTQNQLGPILKSGATTYGWEGIIGETPDPNELRNYLLAADLYIYCGHGSGEVYLHRDKVRSLQSNCSAALLFGCSSGRLEREGIFGPSGAVLAYLRAGSPAVLAMLWDVTDRDIDQLSLKVLQEWLLTDNDTNGSQSLAHVLQDSRDVCKLKYLNGHAAVCYGLPLYVAKSDFYATRDMFNVSNAESTNHSAPLTWPVTAIRDSSQRRLRHLHPSDNFSRSENMVLLCSTPPAPLPVDVAATRPLVKEVATSAASREHVRTLAATTYGRCVLGLAGFLTVATEYLASFVRRMYEDVSEDDLKIVHEILLLLAETVVDEDNATFIARIGAHTLLLRLMEYGNEDIQEATAEVVAACTSSPSAITFPHRVRQVGEVERLWPRAVPLPFDPRDNAPKTADGIQSTLNVLIRQVPTRMTGQRKTGYLLWGAAFVLARWIHKHRDLLVGKNVLEVGSGLGLGGITAARYASHTTLTDYQADTCTALEYNVELNKPFTHEFDPLKPEVKVSLLDWDLTESIEAVPTAEVVIASDIICEPSTAEGFLRVVRHHVLNNPNAVAYLMNANSHSRFGVIHLHALLAASTDLSYTITPVDELPDGVDLLETVSDAQELSYEFYEIRAASN